MTVMRYHSACAGTLIVLAASIQAIAAEESILTIDGEVPTKSYTAKELDAFPPVEVKVKTDGEDVSYQGPALRTILLHAGVPLGDLLKGKELRKYAIVTGADDFSVVFSLPELNAEAANRVVIMARKKGGAPLPESDGPARVISPDDVRPTRWVKKARRITIRDARFADAHEPVPDGWAGPVFRLSQDYPSVPPPATQYPWDTISYRTEPEKYLNSVLKYVYQVKVAPGFRVQDSNPPWYHAPWMHWGPRGREFIHGMTRERTSEPKELAPTQTSRFQNWAVSFYNAPGGYTIGQVWRDSNNPNPAASMFPQGTVAAKLLFTAATTTEVPFLENAYEWDANVLKELSGTERAPQKVRLLQIDVAVRDSRADSTTGWVFATFVYSNSHAGATPLEKMRAVGLMWGNDPGVTPEMVAGGTRLADGWLNPAVKLEHYGWAGRLNGPVDNPLSSCLSCHATAQIPSSSPMTFPPNSDTAGKLRWFRNIKAGAPFDASSVSTDYSLQIAMGIVNYRQAHVKSFTPLTQAFNAALKSTDSKAAEDYHRLLREFGPTLQQPFTMDGKTYYPISRE